MVVPERALGVALLVLGVGLVAATPFTVTCLAKGCLPPDAGIHAVSIDWATLRVTWVDDCAPCGASLAPAAFGLLSTLAGAFVLGVGFGLGSDREGQHG